MSNENKPNYQQRILTDAEKIAALDKRLQTLENYLPVLERHFAGQIGGASVGASDVMDTLAEQPHDTVKDAIEHVDPVAADRLAGEAGESNTYEGADEADAPNVQK